MPAHYDVMVIDYGMGNLFNLQKVLNHLGVNAIVSSDPAMVRAADRLILPGVGAFEDGIRHLKQSAIAESLADFVRTGKPVLGICLGMQLLMQESDEGGCHQGLSLIKGRVERFQDPLPQGPAYKIPHIGWNSLQYPDGGTGWAKTILARTRPGEYLYFVHSYTVCPVNPGIVLARAQYGRQNFCAALGWENIYGCQFHPEISGPVGLDILRCFLTMNRSL